MKGILILAGIITIIILLLASWLFIVELGGFANKLGENSDKIVSIEKEQFYGNWIISDSEKIGSIKFMVNGIYTKGIYNGEWKIEKKQLYLFEKDSWAIYNYYFNENSNVLTLTNTQNFEETIYEKL